MMMDFDNPCTSGNSNLQVGFRESRGALNAKAVMKGEVFLLQDI